MARFFCVYYTATTLETINKKNKKVVIIDNTDPLIASNPKIELKINRGIKYIAYIKDMEKDLIKYRDDSLRQQELYNNNLILQKIKEDETT
jgi:hypothetical protein